MFMPKIKLLLALEPAIDPSDYSLKHLPLVQKHINPNLFSLSVVLSERGGNCFSGHADSVSKIRLGPTRRKGISLVLGYMTYLLSSFFALVRAAKEDHPQVIISFSGHVYSGLLTVIVSKLLGLKSIIRLSGFTTTSLRLRYSIGFLYSAIAELIERFAFRASDAILTNQPRTYGVLHQFSEKVFHISQGVDTNLFSPRNSESSTDGLRLLAVSRLSPEKNLRELVSAISLLVGRYPPISLKIIGIGPQMEDLLLHSKSLGTGGRIAFVGQVNPRHMPDHFREADVFVLPSKTEALPSALLEAMACRIPTVVSENWIVNLHEFEDGVNTYVCDGTARGIAEAVHRVHQDPILREQVVSRAHSHVIENHSIQTTRLRFNAVVVKMLLS